jgi:thymidylate synthase
MNTNAIQQVMKNNTNIEHQYLKLLKDILDNGVEKQDRTGTGTTSVFGRQIRHKMSEGFPLLTTKKMPFKTITTELLWFLRGDTNIKYLVDNNCHIWDGDAYKNYETEFEKGNAPGETLLVQRVEGKSTKRKFSMEKFIAMIQHDDEFAKNWGNLGPIYGKQWRNWTEYYVEKLNGGNPVIVERTSDQIQNLINDLKTNPDSRRLMVNAWNVGEIDQMTLPPCHYGFQVWTRELSIEELRATYPELNELYMEKMKYVKLQEYEKSADLRIAERNLIESLPSREISLMWNQRSVDTFLGLPFNIASYGLLLEIIAKEVNMVPGELIGNLGDTHLYSNHIEQAKEQMHREPMKLPKLCLDYREGEYNKDLTEFTPEDFVLFDYQSHPAIKAPLSN